MEHEERVVEYFVVATMKLDDSQAELEFAYPDEGESTREFCESVTMFLFPHAFGQDWDKRGLPPPPMHNIFALTDVNGDHLYGASLCFYETLVLPSDVAQINDDEDNNNNNNNNNNNGSPTGVQHQAKSICLLSKRPFYTQLLRYLEQLCVLGTRQSRVNAGFSSTENAAMRWNGVEKTLCNIFHEVPVPYRGLAVQLTAADVEIVLEQPLLPEFPFEMDAELMTYAFMVVDANVMLQLYHHVLLEHRILIVCADSVLVTAIAEAIKCLVFPLTWLHVYIPNIPDSLDLSTLLEAPVPFIAGAHTRQLDHVEIPENVVKLEFIAGKFVLGATAPEISLPALPEASHRVALKLGAIRLPDFSSQKREFHEKLWDRRIQLQKMCMSPIATTTTSSSQTNSSNNSSSSSGSILSKPLFLTRPNALYKKVMKLFLEVMAALLQDYPSFVSNDGNQAAFEADSFIERKPANGRAFYREFIRTALFQSFLAQHNDHMSGSLPHDDAIKLHFVHRRLLNDDAKDFRGSFATNSASKTFVAHAPQLPALSMPKRKKSFVLPTRMSISGVQSIKGRPSTSLEPINVSICFPELNVSAFGSPRKIVFPALSNDAATSSLGTFLKTTSTTKQPSKDLGMEWMQQIMKNMSMPTVPFKKPDFMANSDLPAAFKRSWTIDRIGKSIPSSPFYRTMTQKALESTNSIFEVVNHFSTLKQDPQTRVDPVVKSIWLVTTSACACKDQVMELTEALTRVLRHHEKNSIHASDTYCQLIDCLGTCGHPSEAKAVFKECLSGSHLISLETIAKHKYFWKPFSSLMRCYIANGLVQRAFDVMVQVKIEEEQHLDPSLGSLCFGAQVLSSENEVLVERIYTTFSCGNIGIYLAARDSGVGAEVLPFETASDEDGGNDNDNNDGDENVIQEPSLKQRAFDETRNASAIVKEGDAVETINGEAVLQYPLARIVICLKQAYRPMTITFLRGLPKIETCLATTTSVSTSNESNIISDLTSTNFLRVGGGSNSLPRDEQQFRPRKDLCDRFGLLPQKGIRISTLANCTSCGGRASLSEIQEGWSSSDADDYTSRCASCGHRYVPRLCVMLGVMTAFYQPAQDSNGIAPEIHVEQFEYLSMLVIRKELANLSQKIPLTMLSMVELREMNPRIYWNIVVKLLSLSCPLDFLDLPDMTKADSGPSIEKAADERLPAANHENGLEKKSGHGKGEVGSLGLGNSEMHELQQCFLRTLRNIKSTSGSADSWAVLASQMLGQLERLARDTPEGSDTTVPLASAQDGGDADSNDDAPTYHDKAEERRSCRTTSAAESANETEDGGEDGPTGSADFDANIKPALISLSHPETVLVIEKVLLRMPESPRLAPFQRKSRGRLLS